MAVLIRYLPGKLRAHRLVAPATVLRVAPPPGHQEVDLSSRRGTTASQLRDRRADRPARRREPRLGIPADPRRTAQARPPGQRIHDPPGPQGAEDPSGAPAAHRHDVAAVSARPSRDNARHGLLPRGLRGHPPAPVLLVRGRGRACRHAQKTPHPLRSRRAPPDQRSGHCRLSARPADQPHLRPAHRDPAVRHPRRSDHRHRPRKPTPGRCAPTDNRNIRERRRVSGPIARR